VSPDILEIRMQSTYPDLRGNHVHSCPECFEDVPCEDWCTWYGDLVTNAGVPSLHPVVCERCRERDKKSSPPACPPARPGGDEPVPDGPGAGATEAEAG